MSEQSNIIHSELQVPDESAELNKLRLRFGDALQLQLVGEAERYHIRLIGYLENRSIIVTAPVKNRRLIP
ncbi:MAG: hypothetical protein ACI9FB_004603, partial [Candidatus Azotimanducaceae bacterium]